MKTTLKPKVDVAAIMAKAKAKTNEVKTKTSKVDEVKDDYKAIPGFDKYEVNSKGIVRNVKTKVAQSIKKGTTKFYLVNNKGAKKLISLTDIFASLPVAKTQTFQKDAKIKKIDIIVNLHEQNKSIKQIVSETGFKYNSVYIMLTDYIIKGLLKKGMTTAKIQKDYGYSLAVINQNIKSLKK